LSISGGISLGSYQAGVNFGLLEVYRHAAWNPAFRTSMNVPQYRLQTVTGASAGNINTLLWALEACTDLRPKQDVYQSPDPSSSLFWQVWLSIGWDRLFNTESSELALFDRAALVDSVVGPKVQDRLNDDRLVEGCEVPAGITLTRIKPDTLWLKGLAIETQRNVTPFTVRVDSDSAVVGTRVRFLQETRIRPEDQFFGVTLRLQPQTGDIPFRNLLNAVKASASFPVAFAPVELDVWYPRTGASGKHMFSDGGVFDNNPVGFARNLYALDTRNTAPLDILYVNPNRFRSALHTTREGRAQPAPTGGLAAVMALLQGAVPTARQYELQLLARERAHQEEVNRLRGVAGDLAARVDVLNRRLYPATRSQATASEVAARLGRPDPGERLLLSSRAYPVLGEHLSSFAAFLARPGREFDFYVGLYDAFYMALSEHTCAEHSDTTELARQQRHRCVGESLPRLIKDPALVRDPGRQVLGWLYAREYAADSIPFPQPTDPALAERVTVQRSFFNALGTQFAATDTQDCVDTRLVFAILCRDGLWDVLETIGKDTAATRIIAEWSGECGKECEARRARIVCREECQAETVFWHLVNNPMSASTRMLDQVVARLRDVEVMMMTRRDVHGSDMVAPVTGGQALFYTTHLRSRPEWNPIPSSVPKGDWKRKVPLSYFGANLGTSGLEARLQPTWNVGNPTFLKGNLIAHYNGQPIGSSHNLYGGAGIMAGRYFSKVWITEVGFGANIFTPTLSEREPTPWELEASGVFVANQLRLGLRWMPDGEHRGLIHGSRGWAVSAGLNDPMGLIHWITSF
jgi:predicted acylesterase/phospholipase RssA